jgi:hypothetical protein
MPPQVAIIVLNWNGRDDTLACLGSLSHLDYPNHEIVVIDNGSADDSVAAVQAAFPSVTLIEAGDNLGFAGGNNLGLERAQAMHADYALLLNNDTEVAPDCLSQLVEAAEADPKVGVVGPMIYYFAQPELIWSAGGGVDWRWGDTHMIGIGEPDRGQFGDQPRSVDFVTGCALLIKMPVVEQVGPLDGRFFAYYEENEWCVRVQRAGYKTLHVPKAKVWHKISPDAREATPQVHYYMIRNRLLFLKLARARPAAWFNTLVREFGARLVSWTVKPRWRYKAPQRQAMIRAIVDFTRGRFGRVDVT